MLTPSLSNLASGPPLATPPVRTPGLQAAIDRLFDRINYERVSPGKYQLADFELSRMSALLAELNDPQQATPCIHIAGTKGKGSIASLIASVLTAGERRTGLFTSPHIHYFEERVTVGQQWPNPAELEASFQDVWNAVERLDSQGRYATYFEISTALAWDLFRRAQCDIAVVEVGLGGRLDSTNICNPLVTAITSISRDHSKLLGDTLPLIAAEKAGIFKPGIVAVSGATGEAVDTIDGIAHEVGCELWMLDREVTFETQPADPLERRELNVTTPNSRFEKLPVILPGRHQDRNAALVAAICDRLPDHLRPDINAMRAGMAGVVCPLRIEVMSTEPLVILDAAHNGASIAALLDVIRSVPAKQRWLIFGTSKDKHLGDMLAEFAQPTSDSQALFDHIIVTEYQNNPRALETNKLAASAGKALGDIVTTAKTPQAAIEHVLERASRDDLVVVTGSFFLSGEVREHLIEQQRSRQKTLQQPDPAQESL